jgi:hypothetical protein
VLPPIAQSRWLIYDFLALWVGKKENAAKRQKKRGGKKKTAEGGKEKRGQKFLVDLPQRKKRWIQFYLTDCR